MKAQVHDGRRLSQQTRSMLQDQCTPGRIVHSCCSLKRALLCGAVCPHLWKVTCLGLTWRFFTSTLLPHSTMGMFSHTLRNQTMMRPKACRGGYRLLLTAGCRLPAKISVPGRNILVCQPGCDIKHDDGALAMDIVAISKATKLLLSSSIPAVEAQLAPVGSEIQRVDFHTNGGCTPHHEKLRMCCSWA